MESSPRRTALMSCAPLFHISAVSGQEAVPFCAEGQRQPVSSPVNPAVNAASRAEQQKSRAHRLSRQQMKNRVEGAWQTNRQPSRFAAVVASLGCTPLLSCAVWLCVYCIWFQCSCTFSVWKPKPTDCVSGCGRPVIMYHDDYSKALQKRGEVCCF